MRISLSDSVGHGAINKAKDVKAVKTRMAALGFEFFGKNGKADRGLLIAIKLFQSIIRGHSVLRGPGVDGRVDPDGFTVKYLNSRNAPKWELMPLRGSGFINHELLDELDNHDYGTSWMSETLVGAGKDYKRTYLAKNRSAAIIAINDVSIERGGDTPDHDGHETGLSCDLRLPRKDGTWGGILNPNTHSQFDRAAMRAQLKSLWKQPLVNVIYFNDAILIEEGLCQHQVKHGDHVHISISAKSP